MANPNPPNQFQPGNQYWRYALAKPKTRKRRALSESLLKEELEAHGKDSLTRIRTLSLAPDPDPDRDIKLRALNLYTSLIFMKPKDDKEGDDLELTPQELYLLQAIRSSPPEALEEVVMVLRKHLPKEALPNAY
jgi:hypothetical protein